MLNYSKYTFNFCYKYTRPISENDMQVQNRFEELVNFFIKIDVGFFN